LPSDKIRTSFLEWHSLHCFIGVAIGPKFFLSLRETERAIDLIGFQVAYKLLDPFDEKPTFIGFPRPMSDFERLDVENARGMTRGQARELGLGRLIP